jgi:hypothetical protein
MATSIVKNFTADKWYPSANPINCTVTSNFNGKCNFRYICDVYVNGTKVYTSKLFPDPTTGYGFFQISRILDDYIKTLTMLSPNAQLIASATDTSAPTSALTVYCRFGEEYDSTTTCDGTIVQYTNQATSNTFYVYETAIDYEDFPTYDYTDYLVGTASATTTKFLSNSPREIDVTYNDPYHLDFISTQSMNSNWKLIFSVTDVNSSVQTYTYSSPTLVTKKRLRLSVGPYDINKYFDDAIISQFTKSYKVKLTYNGSQVAEEFSFNVKKPYTFNTRIGFVGLKGGLESFTFYHRNTTSYSNEKKVFERTLQSNISNDWTYRVGDRGTTTYAVKSREKHSVNTFCSKEASKWLYEMWLSKESWIFKRPELIEFKIFREDTTPTSRMLFWLPEDHGIVTGDEIFCYPDTQYQDYAGKFTVVSVNDHTIDCGLTFDVYNLTNTACGWVQKNTDWQTLPINITNASNVEVKQRTSRPIQYSLEYDMAYYKTTLR